MYKAYLTVFRNANGDLVHRVDPLNLPCEAISGSHVSAALRSYELQNGTTMIGRLWPLPLGENRVSRTHCEINFSDHAGVLTVTAKGMNPIFVKILPIALGEGENRADLSSETVSLPSSQPAGAAAKSSSTPSASQEPSSSGIGATSTPLTSPTKKPLLLGASPLPQKRQLSELSSLRLGPNTADKFGISPPAAGVAHLLRVSSQIQRGGGFQIRGILDDQSAPSHSQLTPPVPLPLPSLSQQQHDSPSLHSQPSKQASSKHEKDAFPSQNTPLASNATQTPESARQRGTQQTITQLAPTQEVTTNDLAELEAKQNWTAVNPNSPPYIVRASEPGLVLISFLGIYGGPQYQVHVIKVGSDTVELVEATKEISSQDATPTQIVISSPPGFPSVDDHKFAIPSTPISKPKPSQLAQENAPTSPPASSTPSSSKVAAFTTPHAQKDHLSAQQVQPANLSESRNVRQKATRYSVSPGSNPSASPAYKKIDFSDMGDLDDDDETTTTPKKRRANEMIPNEISEESGDLAAKLHAKLDGEGVEKKRKIAEVVMVDDEGEEQVHHVCDEAHSLLGPTSAKQSSYGSHARSGGIVEDKSAIMGAKRRSSKSLMPPPPPAMPARQLFDTSSDDEDEDEISEPIVQADDRKGAPTFSPPSHLSTQPSRMDVADQSMPLPSLAPRDSAFMDMDDANAMAADQIGTRVTRSRSRLMQKEASMMKGVSELKPRHSAMGKMQLDTAAQEVRDTSAQQLLPQEPSAAEQSAEMNQQGHGMYFGEQARPNATYVGGEGMIIGDTPAAVPHIAFEPEGMDSETSYEVAQQYPMAPQYDTRNGLNLPTESALKRSDTMTPSIDTKQLRIIEVIGSGSCGEVYKATWLGLTVAVKKVFRSLIHDSALKEFQAEWNIMKRLRHPNIVLFLGITKSSDGDDKGDSNLLPGTSVSPYGAISVDGVSNDGQHGGNDDGAMCRVPNLTSSSATESLMIVTEFMPLGSLHDVLMDPKTTVDLMAILKMATDAAMGVNYLHQFSPPIIHRDLKSHNLLVGDNFIVKVTDFGLAKLTTSRDDAHMTFCGTLPWAAPEVLSGAGYTVKADVYSFGVVLWELITRQEPYKGLHKPDIIVGVVVNGLRPPLYPDMEPLVVELIEACWAQNPEDRPDFQTIVDRLTEVTDYLYTLRKTSQQHHLSNSSHSGSDNGKNSSNRKSTKLSGNFAQNGNLGNSNEGGEFLNYGSKWLSSYPPGSLDHQQQVALAQEALQAGAAPESAQILHDLENGTGATGIGENANNAVLMIPEPIQTTREAVLKAHREALEVMDVALHNGDMQTVFSAMEQMRVAAEGVAKLGETASGPASGYASETFSGAKMSGSVGVLSKMLQKKNDVSISRADVSAWTLDLNELTSIAKLPEETSPSFSLRHLYSFQNGQQQPLSLSSTTTNIGRPDESHSGSLSLSGTTANVGPRDDTGSTSPSTTNCTAWHGSFRGQDVLVRVWHEALDASEVREFHKQLDILAHVKSPRVALFYGCVLEPRFLMVTEYTPLPSIFTLMTCEDPKRYLLHRSDTLMNSMSKSDPEKVFWDWDVVMLLALEVSKAIASLHLWKPQIVHRDIQSSKFVVDTRTWSVKMNDLGLARFSDTSSSSSSSPHPNRNASTLAKIRGNFLYTAPEVYAGAAAYAPQADIYSFGILLWELVTRCITGRYVLPFSEFTHIRAEYKLLIEVSKDNIRPSLHPDTPEPLAQLITSCWHQDPNIRPVIQDVVQQLEQLKELYEQEMSNNQAPESAL